MIRTPLYSVYFMMSCSDIIVSLYAHIVNLCNITSNVSITYHDVQSSCSMPHSPFPKSCYIPIAITAHCALVMEITTNISVSVKIFLLWWEILCTFFPTFIICHYHHDFNITMHFSLTDSEHITYYSMITLNYIILLLKLTNLYTFSRTLKILLKMQNPKHTTI